MDIGRTGKSIPVKDQYCLICHTQLIFFNLIMFIEMSFIGKRHKRLNK